MDVNGVGCNRLLIALYAELGRSEGNPPHVDDVERVEGEGHYERFGKGAYG